MLFATTNAMTRRRRDILLFATLIVEQHHNTQNLTLTYLYLNTTIKLIQHKLDCNNATIFLATSMVDCYILVIPALWCVNYENWHLCIVPKTTRESKLIKWCCCNQFSRRSIIQTFWPIPCPSVFRHPWLRNGHGFIEAVEVPAAYRVYAKNKGILYQGWLAHASVSYRFGWDLVGYVQQRHLRWENCFWSKQMNCKSNVLWWRGSSTTDGWDVAVAVDERLISFATPRQWWCMVWWQWLSLPFPAMIWRQQTKLQRRNGAFVFERETMNKGSMEQSLNRVTSPELMQKMGRMATVKMKEWGQAVWWWRW